MLRSSIQSEIDAREVELKNLLAQRDREYGCANPPGVTGDTEPPCQTSPYYGDAVADSRPMSTAKRTLYNLSQDIFEGKVKAEKAQRVLDILKQHPEFFDFLEILRSGLV